jgi:hypothetical protein
MLQFLTFAHEAGAVENHDERTGVVQDRRDDRVQPTKRRRAQTADDEQNTPNRKVLVDDRARAARELHEERQPAQIIVHQRNRRAVDRHFAARRAHRDADVACRQRGRVIHAVTDHGNAVTLRLHRPHKLHLVLRQTITLRFFATDLRRHAGGHRLTIAGNHRDAPHASFLSFRQRLARFGRV